MIQYRIRGSDFNFENPYFFQVYWQGGLEFAERVYGWIGFRPVLNPRRKLPR